MNFKTKGLIAFLVISVFLLSSCEVYNTLYGQQTPTGNVVEELEETPEETPDVETPEETEVPEELPEETPEEVPEEVPEEPELVPVEPSGDATVITVEETE